MDQTALHARLLWLTAGILAAFGLLVLAGAAVQRRRGRPALPVLVRYLAWFGMVPPVLLPLVYSRPVFQAVVLVLSLLCLREFFRATGLWADRGLTALCYALTAGLYVPVFLGRPGLHQLGPLPAVALLLAVPIARDQYSHMLQKTCLAILAVVYFGWFLSHLACLPDLRFGAVYAYCLLMLVESNDAFAYLWGTWLGRRRLTPRLSPHKTVEGAVLGAASTMGMGVLLAWLLPGLGAASAMLIAGMAATLGVAGDLVVSFIKRDVGIKDMGRAIPGHGGVLDRCDSLILAAPAVFHVMRMLHAS